MMMAPGKNGGGEEAIELKNRLILKEKIGFREASEAEGKLKLSCTKGKVSEVSKEQ